MSEKRRILLVDDDVDIIEQFSFLLREAGHDVITARGEEEAGDILESVKPDLAIVDLMVDHLDSGFVLCRRIKDLYPETPVLIVTSNPPEANIGMDAATGEDGRFVHDAFIQKPVEPRELVDAVQRLLSS
jgi:CheY-like chemotaxis protein